MKLNLGENIRRLRKQQNLTQEQLAYRLGVSAQSVSRWENGTTYPDLEFIPVMAQIFSTTTDVLLGCTEPEEKMTSKELQDHLQQTMDSDDPGRMIALLRTIRHEYFEELPDIAMLFWHLPDGYPNLYQSESFREELRQLVEDYLTHGNCHWKKQPLIASMCYIEDEDHLKKLIEKHSTGASWYLTKVGMYMNHARRWEKRDLYRELAEEEKLYRLAAFLKVSNIHLLRTIGKDRKTCSSAEREYAPQAYPPQYWRGVNERKLQILHTFNDVVPEKDHPVSGNGQLDLWVEIRLEIGINYAAQLSACGEYDSALTVLEDCAGLLEQLTDFPGGIQQYKNGYHPKKAPRLTCSAPELQHIIAYRAPVAFHSYNDFSEKSEQPLGITIELLSKTGLGSSDFSGHVDLRHGFVRLFDEDFRYDGFDAEWLNPIREHPRYQAVLERIRNCLPPYDN